LKINFISLATPAVRSPTQNILATHPLTKNFSRRLGRVMRMAQALERAAKELNGVAFVPLLVVDVGGWRIDVSLQALFAPGLPGELHAPESMPVRGMEQAIRVLVVAIDLFIAMDIAATTSHESGAARI
jgi:hypothetical protein